MIKFITWLVVTIIVLVAGDSYFELMSRPLLPMYLLGAVTLFFIVIAVAYGYYVIKLLQEVLNINQQSKKEEKK